MMKKNKLVTNNEKANVVNKEADIQTRVDEKEKLINMLKRARLIIGTITIGMTCGGIDATDTIIRSVINDHKSISTFANNEIKLVSCILISLLTLYGVHTKLKHERAKYLYLALDNAFADMKDEMYKEYIPKKTLNQD